MRISDWSSDVYSSDLLGPLLPLAGVELGSLVSGWAPRPDLAGRGSPGGWHGSQLGLAGRNRGRTDPACFGTLRRNVRSQCLRNEGRWQRAEEHTSELQSLLRISYPIFCLHRTSTRT